MQFVRQKLSATVVPDTTSDENRKGWLPISLRRPYLLSLSTVLLLMAVAIEVLRQYSNRQEGIVQYKWKEDLSSAAWRACTDTPTILALFAMVLWEVCAQDVLRLEPYFQLARIRGAPTSVLFINYRFDIGILAPIRAARNRHWIVLCVSSMSLLMRVPVPSLLSGLFVLTPVTLVETKTVDTWPYLVDLDTQDSWFSTEAAYGNTWRVLRGDHSGLYRSSRYATAPVSIPLDYGDEFSILTLNQSVYWSNMTCVNVTLTGAVPSAIPNLDSTTDLTSKRGFSWNLRNITLPEVGAASDCRVSIEIDGFVPPWDGRFQARYWEPMQSSPTTSTPSAFNVNNCPPVGLLGVMINMENTRGTFLHSNVTAFACQPAYRQAIANVSLTWNSTITGVEIMPSTVKDLTRKEYSMHGLQRLMSSERPAGRSRVAVVGDSDILHLTQYQERIGRLWNDAFITTINRFFDPVADVFRVDAEQVTAAVALTLVSQAALIVEIILVLGFLLLLSLSCIYPRRPNLLQADPSSIAAQCACIARLICPETLQALSHPKYHLAKTRDLRQWAKGFWCGWRDGCNGRQIEISSRNGYHVRMCSHPASAGRPDPMPHFLTIPWFAIECILLIGTVAAFGLAFKFMQFQNLESFTSTEVEISSIFLIYGPTLLSSIIRSLFTSIHRHLSVAEPWIRLRRGMVSPEVLLAPSYGSLTILMVSLRSGSRVPAAVLALSFVCLLNLVLVIVSGGLFEPQLDKYFTSTPELTTSYNSSMFLRQGLEMDFQGYDSVIYTLTMNLSSAPWTTTDFSFLPLATNEPDNARGVLYTATTRGIGTYLNCEVVPRNNAFTDYRSQTVNWTYTPFDNPENVLCDVQLPLDYDDGNTDKESIRYIWPDNADPLCQRLTFFVFASWINNASALHCEPKINIQDFHIDFNPHGMIQRHEAVAGSFITSGSFFKNVSEALEDFNQGLGRFVRNLHSHEHLAFYQSSFPGHRTAQAYDKMKPDFTESDPDAWIRAVQSVYRATFSSYLALRRDQFLSRLTPDTAMPVNGTITYTMWGFMPSNSSMVIIIALISVDILALMAIFLLYHGRYDAPRIPKSPGSLIPWVAQSRMLQELEKTYDMDDKEREEFLQQKDQQYHFWPYSSPDGEKIWVLDYVERVGTELALITPSHLANNIPNAN